MKMNRREFLKSGAAITAGGAVLIPHGATAAEKTTTRPKIYVVKGAAPASMLAAGLEKIGGMSRYVPKGGKVTIKPNAAWASRPEQAGNTHPLLIKACIEACLGAGAKAVVLPEKPCSPAKQAFGQSGIEKVCKETGATLYELSREDHFKKVAIPKGKVLKEAAIAKDVLNTDCLINMPVAKSHGSAVLTIAMKNWMGSVADRKIWHRGQLHQCIADFNTVIHPKLIIVDATRIMVNNGPRGPGKVEKPGQIIIGFDQVAVDAYAATLFKKSPFDVPHIKIAHEMGIGCGDLKRVAIEQIEA